MSVTPDRKAEIIKTHARSEGDTGSAEVQVAILTERIINLTEGASHMGRPFRRRASPGAEVQAGALRRPPPPRQAGDYRAAGPRPQDAR